MPKTASCGYGAGQHPHPPQTMLVVQGPEIIVDIGFDPNFTTGNAPAGLAAASVPALVDTGAIFSFIDNDLAIKLNLPIVNQQTISGSNGQHLVNMYLGHIYVPSLTFMITGQFGGVHLVAGGQHHNAILGRSFLMHFKMTYDGLTGVVELTAP